MKKILLMSLFILVLSSLLIGVSYAEDQSNYLINARDFEGVVVTDDSDSMNWFTWFAGFYGENSFQEVNSYDLAQTLACYVDKDIYPEVSTVASIEANTYKVWIYQLDESGDRSLETKVGNNDSVRTNFDCSVEGVLHKWICVGIFNLEGNVPISVKAVGDFTWHGASVERRGAFSCIYLTTDLSDTPPKFRPDGQSDYQVPEPDIENGLVAHYPFNGNANDESGNGNDGIVYGATLVDDRFGNQNNAYSFDGVDDYVSLGDIEMNYSAFSISLWFETNNWNENAKCAGALISNNYSYWGNPSRGWLFWIYDDKFWFSVNHNNSLTGLVDQEYKNKWNNLTFTKNSNEETKIYYNGFEVDKYISHTDWVEPVFTSSENVIVGKREDEGWYFNGIIDDIRIYNRALSDSEIQLLYNEEPSNDTTPPEIIITGIEDEEVYENSVTLEIVIADNKSGIASQSIKLDGEDYVSGTEITENRFHTLDVTATDNAGNTSSENIDFVVYSPYGQVSGGGWIPEDSKKSNFGFTLKYKNDKPTGNFEFQSKESDINLKSKQIDWLAINSKRATFQGTGTIKGMDGEYTFRVDCLDSDGDNFTITIWEGTDTEAEPIYEILNTDLGGGNIKVKEN